VPDSSQITTADAPISISESSPNPASATDRAAATATASTMIPATFQPSVTYSSTNPRRSRAVRTRSSADVTARSSQHGICTPGITSTEQGFPRARAPRPS
jgi:hypothetical protein